MSFSSCGPQALEHRLGSSHWLTGKSQELFLDVIDTLPAFILKKKGDIPSSNFFFFVTLFIFGCAGSLSLLGLVSSCGKWGILSLVAVHGLYFGGLSWFRPRALEHRLSGCETWTSLLFTTWDPPGSGIEPHLRHWQANALPLSHQGNPSNHLLLFFISYNILFKNFFNINLF